MSDHADLLHERRRTRLRALAVAGLLVFVAVVWKLTSGGADSTGDEAEPPSYTRFGAWRAYDSRLVEHTALFLLPDGCVLGVGGDTGEIVVETLGPREGLECAAPRDDEGAVTGMPDVTDATADLPAATRFADGYALLLTIYHEDAARVAVITGSPGAWLYHPVTADADTRAAAIAWDGTDLIVLGTDGEGPVTWRSPNGATWREQRLPGGEPGSERFTLASDGRGTTLAAATAEDAETGAVWRSDGDAWAEAAAPRGIVEDLAHDGTAFQLAGTSVDTAGRPAILLASSADGREWTTDPGFWRDSAAREVVPLGDGTLMVFTDGMAGDDGEACADVVHRRTGDTWSSEGLECGRDVADAVVLPDGRVVAAGNGRVFVREAP
ncbi:hypothetical protein [Phytomonospora endophytica]|uniref:Exo-alpha-sialidase n=1 Tax=Phytomonospora endophytica TaxID=714109 RepID=A0A841FGU1_9ACTN|nr:hypothetical protein [Phytomonospora endophytica]MBB6035446.1 hypothetical protein [Phytomonospora endophytica]GIG63801.1 hypothetical protein Pen01_00960 [Phytomonospora endophytica]